MSTFTTALPSKVDLRVSRNADTNIVCGWRKSDGHTPVTITRAVVHLYFGSDGFTDHYELDSDMVPSSDLAGFDLSTPGIVKVTVRSIFWQTLTEQRKGTWDLVAVSGDPIQRRLMQGRIHIDEGDQI